MKKPVVLILACCICLSALAACDKKNGGDKILPPETVRIACAEDLAGIARYLGPEYKNYTFEQTADIDLSDDWVPLGDNSRNGFCGTYDGGGHSINNLTAKSRRDGKLVKIFRAGNSTGSFPSVGLFGFTDSATIKNLKLNNVDLEPCLEGDYLFLAGLCGYNGGASRFENIEVTGKIILSYIFDRKNTYNEKGEYKFYKDICDVTAYIGGVVGYSSGNSEFKNVSSNVELKSDSERSAFFQTEKNVNPDDIDELRSAGELDKYVEREPPAVSRILAGAVAGYVAGGIMDEVSGKGSVDIVSETNNVGGLAGEAYGTTVTNSSVNNITLKSRSNSNADTGGLFGKFDRGKICKCEVVSLTAEVTCHPTSPKCFGGLVGYERDLSTIEDCSVESLELEFNLYKNPRIGGLVGITEDSVLRRCEIKKGIFKKSSADGATELGDCCGAIVNLIKGDSLVEDCDGVVSETLPPYLSAEENLYYDEDGTLAVRLFEKGSRDRYVVVSVKFADEEEKKRFGEENKIRFRITGEENDVLSEPVYSAKNFSPTDKGCDAEKYLKLYWDVDGGNFRDAENGATILKGGRDVSGYVFKDGRPVINNLNLTVSSEVGNEN